MIEKLIEDTIVKPMATFLSASVLGSEEKTSKSTVNMMMDSLIIS